MHFASTHLHPAASLALAAIALAWMIWYWLRLGGLEVPSSRRKIRRLSLLLMLVALPIFVRGLSFVDRQAEPREYIITWSMAMLTAFIIIVIAGLDAMNNLRLLQRATHTAVVDSARDLVEAIHRRRDQIGPTQAPSNDGRGGREFPDQSR